LQPLIPRVVRPVLGKRAQNARLIAPVVMTARGRPTLARAGLAPIRAFHIASPLMRARGTPDAPRIRSLMRDENKRTSIVTTKAQTPSLKRDIRRSARNGFTACFVLSPATVET